MKFSFIAAFKNRDQKRVRLFLESLQLQSNRDFELLFINQGSDEDVNYWLERLVVEYSFINYYHNYTEGFLWNKSNALNIGIKAAKGEYIIIADIDLIFPPEYLDNIIKQFEPGLFITHNSFYIPESFHIDNINVLISQKYNDQFVENFNGACVVKKEALFNIGVYDEFYLVWGAEDDDIIMRLENSGLVRKHISTSEINIYHQWHPSRSPGRPTLWYLIMVNHLFSVKQNRELNSEWGASYTLKERPVLNIIADHTYKNKVKLEFWEDKSLLFFNPIMEKFHQLKTGEIAYLEYTYIAVEEKKRKSFTFFNSNKPKSIIAEKITQKDISQFFQFFIGYNRSLVLDYFYEERGDRFLFVCIKK
jgi:glycosyltransferase involved in cell wall biosynthesis